MRTAPTFDGIDGKAKDTCGTDSIDGDSVDGCGGCARDIAIEGGTDMDLSSDGLVDDSATSVPGGVDGLAPVAVDVVSDSIRCCCSRYTSCRCCCCCCCC